jgi:hypothetical protein
MKSLKTRVMPVIPIMFNLYCTSAIAHESALLGEDLAHYLYHVLWAVIAVGVVVKGVGWCERR